jgi:hypothetical protein
MTRERVKTILSQKPRNNSAFMRHKTRIVRPYEWRLGVYELEDTKTGYYILGSIDEAVDFLMTV